MDEMPNDLGHDSAHQARHREMARDPSPSVDCLEDWSRSPT